MTTRPGLLAGALAASLSIAVAVAVVVAGIHRSWWESGVVAITVLWATAPLAVPLIGRRREITTDDTGDDTAEEPSGTVTTIVRVGDEPPATVRSSVALAARTGPVIVADGPLDEAIDLAAATDSDAVMIVSARAVPASTTCHRAAGLLDDTTRWVVGATRPMAHERYVTDRFEVVGAALRHDAVDDLVLWETDATLVSRQLLVEHPLTTAHPWGQWLRDRHADGARGRRIPDTLSLRAVPVAAGAYWPDAVARQRARVADLSGATTSGSFRARLSAVALLLRELSAIPAALLLIAVAAAAARLTALELLGALALLGVSSVLRWAALRRMLGVGYQPRADLTAALYHLPGSLGSLRAAVTRRITPVGAGVNTRPLTWSALVLTIVVGWVLISTGRAATVTTGSRVIAGLSLLALGLLWTQAIRALVERSWHRSSYRIRLRLPARIVSSDGRELDVRTIDGSPAGVGLLAVAGAALPAVGDEIDLEIDLDDGSVMRCPGVVAERRSVDPGTVVGIELRADDAANEAWSEQLLRAAEAEQDPHATAENPRRTRAGWVDRVLTTLVVAGSVLVAGALVLVLLGFRLHVVRSGSMVPTYGVGDIVVVDDVPAHDLRPGDVANLEYYGPTGEGLTHRIVDVRDVDGGIEVETLGDANETSETWVVGRDEYVGRVVASIPAIGAIATSARTSTAVTVVVLVVLAGAVALLLGRRNRTTSAPPATEVTDEAAPVELPVE